jgi:outer membrane protein assembly factor BamB
MNRQIHGASSPAIQRRQGICGISATTAEKAGLDMKKSFCVIQACLNFFVPVLLCAVPGMLHAADSDWTRFRGPNGSGIAAGARPPTTWNESQNVKWKVALRGPGSSSPIVVGHRIFVTCWTGYGDGKENDPGKLNRHVICVDRVTGKELWVRDVPAESNVDFYSGYLQEHGFASHTPVSDGERVYVYFGKGGALAYDLDGTELWRVNLGSAANAKNWGSASSPILYQDKVIISASEESHAVYALDKKTGKELWKSEADSLEYSFGTPVLAEHAGRTDLLLNVPEELWALNPDTGKLRWFAETGLPGNIAPSVVCGDGVAYAFGGFPRLGAVGVRLGTKGNATTNVMWNSNNSTYIPTPVLQAERLFFASDAGFATCLDAKTGALIFKERLPGASATGRGKPFYAAAVLADGNVFAVSRYNGTFVFAAQPEFKLIAHNKLNDESQFNATPAISGRQMLVRSDRFLYCLESQVN